jgi:hypothetical protein
MESELTTRFGFCDNLFGTEIKRGHLQKIVLTSDLFSLARGQGHTLGQLGPRDFGALCHQQAFKFGDHAEQLHLPRFYTRPTVYLAGRYSAAWPTAGNTADYHIDHQSLIRDLRFLFTRLSCHKGICLALIFSSFDYTDLMAAKSVSSLPGLASESV